MANTYCQDGYEPIGKESQNIESGDKIVIGGYILFIVVLAVVVLYEASIGIYVDSMSLI